MALVLVRLKFALQGRTFSSGRVSSRVGFVVGWLLALVLGFGAGTVVALLSERQPGKGDLALLIVLAMIWLGWIVCPILMPAAADQLADPERLAMYPITPRQQVLGLLSGSVLSPMAAFAFLSAAGGAFVPHAAVSSRLAAVVAGVVFAFLCVATSRVTQVMLGQVVRSKRGRDLIVLSTGVVAVGLFLLTKNLNGLLNDFASSSNSSAESVLSWLPPGAVGQAIVFANDGTWASAVIRLAVPVATVGLLVVVWEWGIRGRLDGKGGGSGRARTHTGTAGDGLALIPTPIAAMTPRPLTASLSQQLRYLFFRSTKAFQAVGVSLVLAVLVGHTISTMSLSLGAMTFAFMAALMTTDNLFGYDDTAFEYLLTAGAPWRSILFGKALAMPLVAAPLMAVLVLVEAAIHSAWKDAFPAVLLGIAMLLLTAGFGAFISVWIPQNRVQAPKESGISILATGIEGVIAVVRFPAGDARQHRAPKPSSTQECWPQASSCCSPSSVGP